MGVGEKTDALEPFHPERVASRILGMGDMLSLIEDLQRNVDTEKAEKLAKKFKEKKGFDLVENISRKLIEKNIKFKWTFIGKNTFKIKKNKFVNGHKHYFNFIDNIENIDEKYFPNSKIIKKYLDSD